MQSAWAGVYSCSGPLRVGTPEHTDSESEEKGTRQAAAAP